MTQPAVSNHLHALEEHFGVVLLCRSKPLTATPAGRCLEGHARSLVEGLASLEADMALHTEPRGRLLVGASSTPGELFLPGIAAEFSARYPDVALDVHIGDTDETVAALLHRDIEVAVVGREVEDGRLLGRVVGRDELVPVVSDEDRLAGETVGFSEIGDRPFVLRERGSATRRTVEGVLASAGLSPPVALELGSNAAVAGAVAAGAGIGVIPARLAQARPGISRLEIRGLRFARSFTLLVERARQLSPAAQAFVEACTSRSPAEPSTEQKEKNRDGKVGP